MASHEREQRLMRAFEAALELQGEALEHFVRDSGARDGGDEGFRRDLERMLRLDREPPACLRDEALRRRTGFGEVPERIGPYRVVGVIGRGGMGTVYEAEQERPRRLVAVKVLHPWLSTPVARRRLVREAEMLGRLRHPGIAQVFDAGLAITASGEQPYLVMERLHGRPLTDHAAQAGLTLRPRLELLAEICDAVQHAHERGVIHRDLKPANILVEEDGGPKILDFGIAKAVGPELEQVTQGTETRQLLGTLAYMSPEQLAGGRGEPDPRSDLYSLGVVGYELLTGALPVDVRALPLSEALHTLIEQDPVLAGSRDPRLRGDIEVILQTLLERDPARRYASAAEAAQDVRRHLRDEPIVARAPSAVYQVRKFARRNRALVAGVVATFVALAGGLAASLHFAFGEREQRAEAEAGRDRAERESYRADLLLASIELGAGNVSSCRRLLEQAPARLRGFEWAHLSRGLDDALFEPLVGSPGTRAIGLGFAPDGAALRIVGRDGGLRELDAATGRLLPTRARLFAGVAGAIAVLEGGGGRLARDEAGTLHLLDPPDGAASWSLDTGGAANWGAVSQTARAVAVRVGRRLAVHDLDGGALLWEASAVAYGAFGLDFSPDGSRLAYLDSRHLVVIAGARDGAPLGRFTTPDLTNGLAWSPDGRRLAASIQVAPYSPDNRVTLLDAGTLAVLSELKGHRASSGVLAWSPDGRRLAAQAAENGVATWDTESGALIAIAHGPRRVLSALVFSPDGERLAAGTNDGALRIFPVGDARETDVLRGHESYVYPVAFTPDGRRLASGSWDETIRLWSAAEGRELAVLRGHQGYVHSLAFSPDGTTLCSAAHDRTVRLWDAASGRERARVELEERPDVTVVAWSPDGATLALGTGDERHDVRLVDATTRQQSVALPREGTRVLCLAWRPDGSALVTGAEDGVVRRFAAGGGPATLARDLGGGAVCSLAFAPDEARLIAATSSGVVYVLDAATLETRLELHGHRGEAFAAQVSPDGARIASGGRDATLRLWDARTGDALAKLHGHSDYVYSVAFGPAGDRIATGSGDFTVRLWETAPRRERLLARIDADRLRERVGPLVARLLEELQDPRAVTLRLREEPGLSPQERVAAADELLRLSSR